MFGYIGNGMMSSGEILVSGAIGNTMMGLSAGIARAAMGDESSSHQPNRVLVGYCPPGETYSSDYKPYRDPRLPRLDYIVEQHTSCVNTATNSDYKTTEDSIQHFIKLLNDKSGTVGLDDLRTLLFLYISGYQESKNKVRISKTHNLYRAVWQNKKLDNAQKYTLLTKLNDALYGFTEYLTDVFETATFEQIKLLMQNLPLFPLGNTNDMKEGSRPTVDNNLYLSLSRNSFITQEQKLTLLKKLSERYKPLREFQHFPTLQLLTSDEILNRFIGNKAFEDFIFDTYAHTRLYPIIHKERIYNDLLDENLSLEDKLFSRLLISPHFKDKTIKLLLDVYIGYYRQNTIIDKPRLCLEKYYQFYFNASKSVQDIEREYDTLQNKIMDLKSCCTPCWSQDISEPLLNNIKKMADDRILTLVSEAKKDSKSQSMDDKPQHIREFLGKQPNASCWNCFWSSTTPSQKAFDELKTKITVKNKALDLKM